jgi:hypothetical protein
MGPDVSRSLLPSSPLIRSRLHPSRRTISTLFPTFTTLRCTSLSPKCANRRERHESFLERLHPIYCIAPPLPTSQEVIDYNPHVIALNIELFFKLTVFRIPTLDDQHISPLPTDHFTTSAENVYMNSKSCRPLLSGADLKFFVSISIGRYRAFTEDTLPIIMNRSDSLNQRGSVEYL